MCDTASKNMFVSKFINLDEVLQALEPHTFPVKARSQGSRFIGVCISITYETLLHLKLYSRFSPEPLYPQTLWVSQLILNVRLIILTLSLFFSKDLTADSQSHLNPRSSYHLLFYNLSTVSTIPVLLMRDVTCAMWQYTHWP